MTSGSRLQPREHVPLAPSSTLRIGGQARWLVRACTLDDIRDAHAWAEERSLPMFVLAGGSNVVIADEGFNGLVMSMGVTGVTVVEGAGETTVSAGAGEPWDRLVESTVTRGLAGLECLSGIPGTVGGTPIQNVGAYGQEVASSIEDVLVFDRTRSAFSEIPARDCGFSYRTSRFKGADAGRFIVCQVTFRLAGGPPTIAYPDLVAELAARKVSAPRLADVRRAVLDIRRRKGMVLDEADPDTRSVGSFFMNPVVGAEDCERVALRAGAHPPSFPAGEGRVKIPAAWLIERSGFRARRTEGPAGLSTKHPLAIVNRGGATARDVLRFAVALKRAVVDWCGIWLRPEPVFVGLEGDEDVEFLQRAHG